MARYFTILRAEQGSLGTAAYINSIALYRTVVSQMESCEFEPATNHGFLCEKVGNFYGGSESSTGISRERWLSILPTCK